MKKNCPPGVFCIENYTLVFLLAILFGLLIFVYTKMIKKRDKSITVNHHYNSDYTFDNKTNNSVLRNPFKPPLRNNNYMTNDIPDNQKVPINISTRAIDVNYRQVGILTRENGKETILPLMGRPLYTNRDKWQFYTLSDQNNSIKLPITFKGKSCTNEYGCDNLYNGDVVYVEGYNDAFKVTSYDNNTMKYIPFV